jgi:hypothetical protein
LESETNHRFQFFQSGIDHHSKAPRKPTANGDAKVPW